MHEPKKWRPGPLRDPKERNPQIATVLIAVVALVAVACSSPNAEHPASKEASSPAAETNVLSPTNQRLEPGTYVLDLTPITGDDRFPNVSLTVPEGWENRSGWGVRFAPETERWMGITFWDVGEVYAHPCRWLGKKRLQPGPTAADLAEVLATRPLRNATAPIDIEVDGYSGKELVWSVPDNIDFATCDADAEGPFFESWTAAEGSLNTDRYQQGPGQVDRLWILDVDGQRLVVDAMYMPGATAKDQAMLRQVMESLRFES